MFQKILTEEVFFLLNIRGQSLDASTLSSKLKAIVCLSLEGLLGILLTVGILDSTDDLYSVLENITGLITLLQIIFRSVILFVYKDNFLNSIIFLKIFWKADRFGATSFKKISNFRLQFVKILRIYRLIIGISGTLYLTKPLFEKHRMLPMTCLLLCDIHNDVCYVFYYIFQIIALATQLIMLVGFDSLFFVLLMCAYVELEQIKQALSNLSMKENAKGDQDEVLKEMITIIEHHNLVLGYIGIFNHLFKTALLFQFGFSIFSLCSSLFVMTTNGFPPTTGNFLKSGPYCFSGICQIFIYSAVGELIAQQTERISDAAYETKWILNYQPSFRKMLLLLIQRAQLRSQITVGGVWKLDMTTFASILKGSMSLMAFIQTVYYNKK
uniref:Odorant receptor n=1 Tax=Protaetia brevitarsis TaxID=348688 RepID=A0A411HR64_PROBE|nr:odorant receptor [Protaetia brevitarsis]